MRSTDRRQRRLLARGPRAGISLVEIVVTLSVLVVAGSIFCQTLVAGRRVRLVNRENALAADAARVVIERMRNEPFLNVYRDYNEDPGDDVLGNGTGPGSTFDVSGLEPPDGSSGKAGRVILPSRAVQVTLGGGGKLLGGGGTTTVTEWHLREDVEDEELGMPRDLDGDNVVDGANHAADYLLLPIKIRVEWKSGNSARSFEVVTQLADFPLESAP